ncbi:MAG: GIY-YIG nuclease family protein [Cyanobacteria bacterium]|nr:GIY-YIG nuclease family protein [Cyanobacteriota bacterium]
MHGLQKNIVYIIRSDRDASKHYTGITNDLDARLHWHNHGDRGGHTANERPWSLVVAFVFPTEAAARRFEVYLKGGSGRAFSKRHFGVT